MIDLDAIKAAGLNSNTVSMRMLAEHEYRERIELYVRMCSGFIAQHPTATPEEVEQYRVRAAAEVGI